MTRLTVNGVQSILAKDGPESHAWQVQKVQRAPGSARMEQGLRGHPIGQDEHEQDDEERNEVTQLKKRKEILQ